jgi:branched-chain amino acid transport system permease protein
MLSGYALISGILYGLFYGCIGIGLNLLFGVMRLVNLAHGDLIVFGGYLAYLLATYAHLNPLWAIPVSIPLALAAGFVLYHITVPRLSRSPDTETASLILFFGIAWVLEAIFSMAFGNNPKTLSPSTFGGPVHLFGQPYASSAVVSALVSIPALGVLFAYLYRTRLGLATRAVMADEHEAATSGVRVRTVAASAFAIGVAFAVASGPLAIFMLGGVDPTTGGTLTVTAFTVIIIGSLGNPLGTAVGGLLYGLALSFTQTFASEWSGLVPFALLLVVVLVRPSGLLGRRTRSA